MASTGGAAKVPSLPPPRPKSPPQYPDLYGKRRELAKVQMLEREISFLEDELKFVAGLQPASKSCEEVADFITAKPDPLTPTSKRVHKSCRFWRWLCGGVSCFSFSWIFCCHRCVPRIQMPHCCECKNLCNCISCSCIRCTKPKCRCCSCHKPECCCFRRPSCSLSCCTPKCPSCSNCCCFCNYGCTSCYPKCPRVNYPKCPRVNLCSCCTEDCCYNYNCNCNCCCYICY